MHRFMNVWISLRSSLWFVPSLIVAGAVALAIALVEVDASIGPDVLAGWPLIFGAGAEGSRGMLSAIAGAMITVAGVVFSITIVALSLTSSQYTSRVLRNFMRDRMNQIVLGAFVGIYAYCLVVLRTIRGAYEASFVPSLATMGAMVLAFVGIGLLIHFIHHITSSIQAARILAAIRQETSATIERLFPEPIGHGFDSPGDSRPAPHAVRWNSIAADRTGYVQHVAAEALMDRACRDGVVVRIPHLVGTFVIEGTTLVDVGADSVDDEQVDALRTAFTIGEQRTVEQDPPFGVRQIVDIALKALSPSVNDPTTATMCLDHLGALLIQLASRRFPSPLRYDRDGTLRVIVASPTFDAFVGFAIDEVRFAASDSPVVLLQLVRLLRALLRACRSPDRCAAVLRRLQEVATSAAALDDQPWRERVQDAIADVYAEFTVRP